MNDLKLVKSRVIIYAILAFVGAMLIGVKLQRGDDCLLWFVMEFAWGYMYYSENARYKELLAKQNEN